MKIKIVSYTRKNFYIEDLSHKIEFKIPEKTLINLLKLNPNVLPQSLVGKTYYIESAVVEF